MIRFFFSATVVPKNVDTIKRRRKAFIIDIKDEKIHRYFVKKKNYFFNSNGLQILTNF